MQMNRWCGAILHLNENVRLMAARNNWFAPFNYRFVHITVWTCCPLIKCPINASSRCEWPHFPGKNMISFSGNEELSPRCNGNEARTSRIVVHMQSKNRVPVPVWGSRGRWGNKIQCKVIGPSASRRCGAPVDHWSSDSHFCCTSSFAAPSSLN